ncbi:uncharacterized protein SCHCODRAFT_02625423 [Schizophyllum commune H4-8]|uniref:uncharacterized protein n=1 Tax=Schizophyllum commune (strain H4-8 / FGSC 9210) TaxID=578458 RepID=UPI00215FC010|nr:uncharacterized protein SCHCODRAFT_02625423 [Schizophyllum commune H4-8]KAI5892147.1 hypothetical protein SCHCODRAFT_02625423 [Schizophyllum commune H4-8]
MAANPVELPLGMLLIGLIISSALYGLVFLQGYIYFRSYPGDATWLKVTVVTILLMDTVATALSGRGVYNYLVTNYGHPEAIGAIDPALEVESLLTVFVTFITQVFYGHSISKLAGQRRYVAWIIYFIGFVSLAFGVAACVNNFVSVHFAGLSMTNAKIISGFALGGNAVCDFAITLALCLLFTGSKTGFKPTDSILDRLLVFTINRGAIALVVQIFNFALYMWNPANLVWAPFHFCLSKIYSISLIATLNQRDKYRQSTFTDVTSSASFRTSSQANSTFVSQRQRGSGGIVRLGYMIFCP